MKRTLGNCLVLVAASVLVVSTLGCNVLSKDEDDSKRVHLNVLDLDSYATEGELEN